jgi:hypothetical protein
VMRVEYGWIVTLICLKPFWFSMSGNITPLLALVCLFPLGAVLVILAKPHFILFALIHSWMKK